jgi:serine/threonine protein kinase
MELLEGTSFVNIISSKGYLNEKVTKLIIKQLIEAVDYCHSQNVVHRDIKPDNVMVNVINNMGDEHYIVKLCDFGIATILEPGQSS